MKNFDFDEPEEFEDPEEAHFKEKSKRASRRHHKKRMKNKAKKKLKQDHWFEDDEEHFEEYIAKNADHLANCSCWMCGNPRNHFKGKDRLTRQELLAERLEKEQFEEFGINNDLEK